MHEASQRYWTLRYVLVYACCLQHTLETRGAMLFLFSEGARRSASRRECVLGRRRSERGTMGVDG